MHCVFDVFPVGTPKKHLQSIILYFGIVQTYIHVVFVNRSTSTHLAYPNVQVPYDASFA